MTIKLSKRLFFGGRHSVRPAALRAQVYIHRSDTGYYEGYDALVLLFNLLLTVSTAALIVLPMLKRTSEIRCVCFGSAARLFSILSGAGAAPVCGWTYFRLNCGNLLCLRRIAARFLFSTLGVLFSWESCRRFPAAS